MEIEGTRFGTITIDGKTYEHDVIIRLSGEVVKREKKLSKKFYGTSHVLSKDEAKFVFEKGCEQLILGSGQMGRVPGMFRALITWWHTWEIFPSMRRRLRFATI